MSVYCVRFQMQCCHARNTTFLHSDKGGYKSKFLLHMCLFVRLELYNLLQYQYLSTHRNNIYTYTTKKAKNFTTLEA